MLFEDNFLSELTLVTPKIDDSGDILFATYYQFGDLFNIYAAPNDSRNELMTYDTTVNNLKKINKKTKQNWFIPDRELMMHMYTMRNVGDFINTFVIDEREQSDFYISHYYWTSTKYSSSSSNRVYSVDFTDGDKIMLRQNARVLNHRLCRIKKEIYV